jgi:ABC-type uncharacterized transport system permease subunit
LDIERATALLGVACYVAASLLASGFLIWPKMRGARAALALLAVGATALAAVLVSGWVRAEALPVFSRFEAMTCYAVALSGAYLLLNASRKARGIGFLLIPAATVILLSGVSGGGPAAAAPVPAQGPWLVLHVVTAFAAYGVFTLASISAAVYLIQDSNLKHKRFGLMWERLPSLESLDQSMNLLAGIAFLLLTSSIVAGFLLVRASGGGDAWFTDPKVAATVATWILLAVFVHLRASSDRHGRGIALVALAGLACLLFTFVGVHWVSATLHAFLKVGPGAGVP